MNDPICAAIRKRAVVQFWYDGALRTFEPHCHGLGKSGNRLLRGFQTGGSSSSGNPVGWKLLTVANISGWTEIGSTFRNNRPDYNPSDPAILTICCRV